MSAACPSQTSCSWTPGRYWAAEPEKPLRYYCVGSGFLRSQSVFAYVTLADTCQAVGNALSFVRRPVLGIVMRIKQRRTGQRIPIVLPVEIRWKNRAGRLERAMGKTGNISGSRLFIEIPTRLHQATSVAIKVTLPREVTQVPMELLCQGRVVRWNQRGKVQGVAAVIDEYELRPVRQTRSGGKHPPRATKPSSRQP